MSPDCPENCSLAIIRLRKACNRIDYFFGSDFLERDIVEAEKPDSQRPGE